MRRLLFTALALVPLALAIATGAARATEVQRVVSPGGIEAWLVTDHANPILSVRFAFRGGAALDPQGKEGLANFASGLLDEGAGDLDSEAFQSELADRSITLFFDASQDEFGGTLRTLTRERHRAFELLRLALTQPRFDAEPVERIRSQVLAGLARDAQNPQSMAWKTLRRQVFGDHPYARPVEGTPQSVAALTVDDLRAFAATHLSRDRLLIGVAGDIDPAALGKLLDVAFGALPASAGTQAVAEAAPSAQGGVTVIKRDQPQSVVAIAQPGIKRDDSDYYAAYVVNYVLGGGSFTSRLFREIREQRGLAYSVFSALSPSEHGGLVVAGMGTTNGRVGEAIDLLRTQWRQMAKDGPTAAELADAKTYLTGSFPLNLSSTSKIAGVLLAMQIEDLGIDYIDRRAELIDAVTLDDARRAARRILDPDALSIVVVGEPTGLAPTRPAPEAG